ncbi:hypothetical protein TNCV_305751 [Trichonephila clavipes]|nr:hypothetical protein TNCV_305751 [Trichonephila clavipes]
MFQSIRAANRVLTHRVFSTNDNLDSHPTSGVFPPTSDAYEIVPMTTPPCQIFPTNQETLSQHLDLSTSGHIQHLRYRMEERFAFHFPVTSKRVFHIECHNIQVCQVSTSSEVILT